uniref:Uncharacterized protein n=1 Tax=Panagrolaimus superbus TaxID=310955 RepID=A0A914YH94_9BILA
MLTTRDVPNFNNTIATQVADSDLFNALLHPSSAGHSSQNFGNQNFAGLPPWEKDRLLLELMEQNRRQQLEIQRLVQQNMIRQGRPVMPFMEEEGNERFNLPSTNNNNNLRGQIAQIPSNFVDLNKQRNEFLNGRQPPQQNGMILPLNLNGRGENNIDPLTIMNSIRTMTSRAANGLDQIVPQGGPLTPTDLEFLRRQANPFEAPQRPPFQQQQHQQQQQHFSQQAKRFYNHEWSFCNFWGSFC